VTTRRTFALAILLVSHPAFGSTPRFVEYLYIEANEGASSGGHVAIRFGDETYNFQHERPGVIRLQRDGSDHFLFAYGVLENRTVHVSRIAVPSATWADLRQRFAERYLTERRLFEERDALRDDSTLLEALLARRHGDGAAAVALRGAGYFFPAEQALAPSGSALALRARVLRAYGGDFIARRADDLRRELARLRPGGGPPPEIPARGYPHFDAPYSSRYRDLLTALAALEALRRALPLRADAQWSVGEPLAPDEQVSLAAFADRLAGELTRLLRSDRADWGYAFLVGLARLAALDETARTGRLVLLDAFPPESEVVPWSSIREQRDAVAGLVTEAREELATARGRLRAGRPIDEADYAGVEDAGNRLLELEAAVRDRRGLRVSAERLVPSREAHWADLVDPEMTDGEMERGLRRANDTARRFATELERRYAYDLFSRNCVSEIFATVGAEPGSLDFIPFVSARTVNARWPDAERVTLPSYRRWKLEEMSRTAGAWRTWLRESNTVTSTIYRRNPADSFFLFFTDDVVAVRPLLGVVNVAAAVGAGAAGLALLPFDHGRTLVSGLRGAVFSLPELAFVNLRKGSFTYVPRADRPVDALPGVAAAG
jgi:hypothetical protein